VCYGEIMHVLCKISVVRCWALQTTMQIGGFAGDWMEPRRPTSSSNTSATT
jgi:hypothetical protein